MFFSIFIKTEKNLWVLVLLKSVEMKVNICTNFRSFYKSVLFTILCCSKAKSVEFLGRICLLQFPWFWNSVSCKITDLNLGTITLISSIKFLMESLTFVENDSVEKLEINSIMIPMVRNFKNGYKYCFVSIFELIFLIIYINDFTNESLHRKLRYLL